MLGISSSITKSDRRKWCLARINLLRTASRICGKTTLFTLGAVHLKNWCDTNMFTSHWLLTFWCCLALRARCGSRWSRVSISSPSFSLLSYSWKHFQPKEKKKIYIIHLNSALSRIFWDVINIWKTDLEHLISDLPLQSGNTLVIPKLGHFLVPEPEQAESFGPLQLFIGHKVELLLQLL